ncbi:hypothetical protein BCON_0250g00180 [Botryotinia convoluta]|uniref:C2H2-type domain-containing protein n=1 Tax=Botryotinia convoluta TaxID=54673 RepID=A0A4Z1HH55_9HELO|nr:hypothetical protein BCON_0250g00180 [Botryotinia convoluta]
MSTKPNKKKPSRIAFLADEHGFQFELSPSEIPIDNLEASLDHSPATFPFTHPTEDVLYDNVETLDIINWNDDARAGQTAYFQGLWDGIDAAINLHGQEMDFFASAPNTTTEQGFISEEADTNTALIRQQATPTAPLIGSFVNHVAPAPRFACDSIGCGKIFGRQSDCNRHMKKHGAPEYSCPAPGCGREFYRRDKLMDHARRVHHLEL